MCFRILQRVRLFSIEQPSLLDTVPHADTLHSENSRQPIIHLAQTPCCQTQVVLSLHMLVDLVLRGYASIYELELMQMRSLTVSALIFLMLMVVATVIAAALNRVGSVRVGQFNLLLTSISASC